MEKYLCAFWIFCVTVWVNDVHAAHYVNSTELFFIRLDPGMFWPDLINLVDVKIVNHHHRYHQIEYESALKSMPDLPTWITQRQVKGSLHAYLYGAAPKAGVTEIDVVALNKNTYQTLNRTIVINAIEKPKKANFEVQIKLYNMTVEEMLHRNYHLDLLKIFQRSLWNPQPHPEEDVYLTLLASAVDMGYRRPSNLKEKEGVVVHIGSPHPFTEDLVYLAKEVKPLLVISPCPKDYRIPSVHRFFSNMKHFVFDWCEFKLFSHVSGENEDSHFKLSEVPPEPVPVYRDENDFFRPPAAKSHTRNLLLDFILCIVIPSAVILVLLIGLTFYMFCNKEKSTDSKKIEMSVELSEYNTIQRASHKLREMAINREQPMLAISPPSTNSSIHGNSLPRNSPTPDYKLHPSTPAIRLNESHVRLGAGVRRPSSLRPYPSQSLITSRRNSAIAH